MIRCLLKLYDRNPNINKSIDASVYLAIRANNLLNADGDTIEEYKEDIRDMGFSLSNLYGKSTQYYANFCKTEDFFYNHFRSYLNLAIWFSIKERVSKLSSIAAIVTSSLRSSIDGTSES